MGPVFHVDTQFLRNALGVFEDLNAFEQAARSSKPLVRATNVSKLVGALDLCNLLVLGERVVFDTNVGGGRQQRILDQIDRVANTLRDPAVADEFRASFGGVAPSNDTVSREIQLKAASDSTAFFPRLARCATNVLDLFHLPHSTPTDPGDNLIRFLESRKQPHADEIAQIGSKTEITGRRFYAALLSNETAFRALCHARERAELTDDVLAVLFMNFRLRLAEERSLSKEKVFVGSGAPPSLADNLVYLPSMGRRDFCREFSRFVRWGSDPETRNGHAFDLGLREYVLEEWEDVGCQLQLSERRSIPMVVASVLGSPGLARDRRPEVLLEHCLQWRKEHQKQIADIRAATREFESFDDEERRAKAAAFVAEMLKSPSTEAARNRALSDRMSVRDGWLGLAVRVTLKPIDTMKSLLIKKTDDLRKHFETVDSEEYAAATHLSEAARPLLLGVGSDLRQRLIDVFGGTVIDARNPMYDPDRFPASA
ncbi:MAG: hypothetical protein V3T86_09245 [Planctomycetota bacterium]